VKNFPLLDTGIIFLYLTAMIVTGFYFGLKKKDSRDFMIAGGKLPGWIIGISIFGTYLSSNTFLGIPGKAFSENWNSFVFSLSIPFAAWIAVKYFIPFYRQRGEISAYSHLENRFGKWAKIYAVICFMLTQLARIGSILFGIGLVISSLFKIDLWIIILVIGFIVMVYTSIGGFEAVIWTDVIQSIILFLGAIAILWTMLIHIPGGLQEFIGRGLQFEKFSLGSWDFDFFTSTVWVVFIYGIFINLTNFGIDQNYVQRYHAARSEREASYSVWLLARVYIPVSLLFFMIGTSLFVYTLNNPGFLSVISENISGIPADVAELSTDTVAKSLSSPGKGDRILPLFITYQVPPGLSGFIVSALLAAAMSTISSSVNSSATIYYNDIHNLIFKNRGEAREGLKILRIATVFFGILSTGIALLMIGVGSILDAWWLLSGIFSGGMLGLFLLGLLTKAERPHAALAVTAGVIGIAWLSLSPLITGNLSWFRSPFHANMIVVIGTLIIFLAGLFFKKFLPNEKNSR
jgi:SSS family solute:Na+ symporter